VETYSAGAERTGPCLNRPPPASTSATAYDGARTDAEERSRRCAASVRSAFGFGRRTSSKIILLRDRRVILLHQVGISAITSGRDADIEFFGRSDYFPCQLCSFFAPRSHRARGRTSGPDTVALPRASRVDCGARFAALTSVMFVLTLDWLLLYIGHACTDDLQVHRGPVDLIFPILGGSIRCPRDRLGRARARVLRPRRAYATALIVGASSRSRSPRSDGTSTRSRQYALLLG
jgi:hypothetical protein